MNSEHFTWIYTHNIDPWAIEWHGLALSWYWLSYLLGYLFIFFLSPWQAKRSQTISPYLLATYIQWALPLMLVSARLFYVFFYYPSFFWEHPNMIPQFWRGGMSFHGALLGPLALAYFMAKKHEISIYKFLDPICLFLPITLFMGRIANFVNGELVGKPTHIPFGVIFPQYLDQLVRHPSQLYQALTEGLLLFLILWLQRAKLKITSLMTSLFLGGYGTLRFLVEFFREPDPQLGAIWMLNFGQWLSIFMVIIALFIYSSRSRTTRYSASKTSPED